MKSKALLFSVILPIFMQCQTSNKDQDLIHDFVNEIILESKENLDNIDKFVNLNQELSSNEEFKPLLRAQFEIIRSQMEPGNFEVLTFSEAKSKNLSTIEDYREGYEGLTEVYFVTQGSKIITPIIIKEGKIVSYTTTLTKNRTDKFPLRVDR